MEETGSKLGDAAAVWQRLPKIACKMDLHPDRTSLRFSEVHRALWKSSGERADLSSPGDGRLWDM